MRKPALSMSVCLILSVCAAFATDREDAYSMRHGRAWYQSTLEAIKNANNDLTVLIPYEGETYRLQRPIDMDKFNRVISSPSYYVDPGMTSWHKTFKLQFINVSLKPVHVIVNNTSIIYAQDPADQTLTIALKRDL